MEKINVFKINYSIKKTILSTTIPITVIVFVFFTQWWKAKPLDGPETLYWGYPFIFMGEGWHTSSSYQFFVLEFIADFIIYFVSTAIVIFIFFKRFILQPTSKKIITTCLWIFCSIIILLITLMIYSSNSIYHIKRSYQLSEINKGIVIFWYKTNTN